ncbi:MAG: response regulator transcription factor [Balneolaceae bacterium]|nr:response regulator transcription factor [Balneolaceae bacterium]
MSNQKLNILIADDHKIVRDGLTAMLEDAEYIRIVGEANNGAEVLEICSEKKVDVIIMDINMAGMGGVEATEKVTKQYPDIKVLGLTMLEEEGHVRNMIRAGATGCVTKDAGRDELLEAIDAVASDQPYFNQEATFALAHDEGDRQDTELTDREREILELICDEYTNKEIADRLHISVRTVDAHRRNLLQKTGARNTAGLVRYAMKHVFANQ